MHASVVQLPQNDAIHRLEQAFQLVFDTSDSEYVRLVNELDRLGGMPTTFLVKGESGSGKTFLIQQLAQRSCVRNNVNGEEQTQRDNGGSNGGIPVVTITISDLALLAPGELAKGLEKILDNANKLARSGGVVVVFDNVELIFAKYDGDESLKQVFRTTLQACRPSPSNIHGALWNNRNMKRTLPRMLLIGVTREERLLDPLIKTLFEETIELEIPTPEERVVILDACTKIHRLRVVPSPNAVSTAPRTKPLDEQDCHYELVKKVAGKCHGYLPADLDVLCVHATRIMQQRAKEQQDEEVREKASGIQQHSYHHIDVQHLLDAMQHVQVSALRQSISAQKIDPVPWSSIGGLEQVKATLEESVIWLYKHQTSFARLGITPSKGILLYGPPGTGKTMLAKAVATESEANFMAVSIPDLIKGEVGESEKAVARIFRTATRCSPCVVFLDELEAMFGTRESSSGFGKQLISQLLLDIDDSGPGVVILAATNHPEMIDSSILRPGRLDRLVYVPPPTKSEREAILRILSQSTRFDPTVNLDLISERTDNYTGADLKALVRKAGLAALKASRNCIQQEDFEVALLDVKPSIDPLAALTASWKTFSISSS
ncbi:hypothetical protein BGW42_008737 [Actinomortierella wolfii]|nr:hypothetical protein BGW42_008737 [Actinomortierella wolfii]